MSQNIMNTATSSGLNIQVIAGWDRQLSQLFCTIQVLDDIGEDQMLSEAAEQHLDVIGMLPLLDPKEPKDIETELGRLGVATSPQLLKALEDDMKANAGNVIREFDQAGQLLRKFPNETR